MRRFALLLLVGAAGLGIASGAHAASGTSAQNPNQNQPKPIEYTVADGDSLSSIAAANNLPSWMPLWDVNTSIQNPDQITPGEQLIIPTAPFPATDRALPAGYAAPAPVAVSTAVAPAKTSYRSASRAVVVGNPSGIAQHVCMGESGCNYATNTGNGYSGAYQFDNGTWGGYGGYSAAYLAPPAVQDAKFQQEYAARGCSPWPNTCR